MQINTIVVVLAGMSLLSIGVAGGFAVALVIRPASTDAPAADLATPSPVEANAAWNYFRLHNAMGYDEENKPDNVLDLGDCVASSLAPGVLCMTTIKKSPDAEPYSRNVGFARSADGIWIATPM